MRKEHEMVREEGREEGKRFTQLHHNTQTSGKTHRETGSSEECKIFLPEEAKMLLASVDPPRYQFAVKDCKSCKSS